MHEEDEVGVDVGPRVVGAGVMDYKDIMQRVYIYIAIDTMIVALYLLLLRTKYTSSLALSLAVAIFVNYKL